MPTLKTGLVSVAGYADKVRKTIFAQNKSLVKDKEWSKALAYGAAVINVALYKLLVDELHLDKRDVVRVSIDYNLDQEKKTVVVDWDSLSIEVYKRQEPDAYSLKVESFKHRIKQQPEEQYSVSKIGETVGGDEVYAIKLGEREVGVALVYPVNDTRVLVKKLVVLEPAPLQVMKQTIELGDASVEQRLTELLSSIKQLGVEIDQEKATKTIELVKSSII